VQSLYGFRRTRSEGQKALFAPQKRIFFDPALAHERDIRGTLRRAFFYLPGSAHRGSFSAAATHAPRRVTPDGGSLRDVEFDAALDSRHGRKLAVARSGIAQCAARMLITFAVLLI